MDSPNVTVRKVFDLRTIVAAVLAPLFPGALFALLSLRSEPYLAIWYFELGAILGYASVPFGIPIHYFLVRKGLTFLPAYLLLGGLLGIIPFSLVLALGIFIDPEAMANQGIGWTPFLILSFFLGGLAGLFFWLVAAPNKGRQKS